MHFLSLLALAASVQAHFILDYPPSRGFDEDIEATGPCGGYNTVTTNRTEFSLSGGQYQIDSRHATAIVAVVISADGSTFGTTAVQQYSLTGLGDFCAKLPALSGYTAGSNATLQIIYKSSTEATALYQCADIVFTNATVDASASCANATAITASNVQVGSIALASSSGTNATTSGTTAATAGATTSNSAVSGAVGKADQSAATLLVGTGLFALVTFGIISI